MPGHWTGSVFLSVLSISAVAISARAVSRRAWRQAACWATAAVGVGCLAAQNVGVVDQELLIMLLMGAFMLQRLLLQRTSRA